MNNLYCWSFIWALNTLLNTFFVTEYVLGQLWKIVNVSFKRFTGGFCEFETDYDIWKKTYMVMAVMASVIVINVVLKRAFTITNVLNQTQLYWLSVLMTLYLYHLLHLCTVDVTDLIPSLVCDLLQRCWKERRWTTTQIQSESGLKIQLLLYVNGLRGLYWALHSHAVLIADCTVISQEAQWV